MKARKKAVEIDYLDVNFPLGDTFLSDVKEWVKSFGDKFSDHFLLRKDTDAGSSFITSCYVKTLEGTSYGITPNDVIIRGIKGEYYPCKKDIFEETYYKIDE